MHPVPVRRRTVADAVVSKQRVHVVDADGLVHQFAGYDRVRAMWQYNCGVAFTADAHMTEVATGVGLTCVACMAACIEEDECSLSTPW